MSDITVSAGMPYSITVSNDAGHTIEVVSGETSIIEVINAGPPGLKGDKGDKGEDGLDGAQGSDLNYVHNQMAASATWTVAHNLNKYASITVVDSSNEVVMGDIDYTDMNNVTLSFVAPFSGKAYFN